MVRCSASNDFIRLLFALASIHQALPSQQVPLTLPTRHSSADAGKYIDPIAISTSAAFAANIFAVCAVNCVARKLCVHQQTAGKQGQRVNGTRGTRAVQLGRLLLFTQAKRAHSQLEGS